MFSMRVAVSILSLAAIAVAQNASASLNDVLQAPDFVASYSRIQGYPDVQNQYNSFKNVTCFIPNIDAYAVGSTYSTNDLYYQCASGIYSNSTFNKRGTILHTMLNSTTAKNLTTPPLGQVVQVVLEDDGLYVYSGVALALLNGTSSPKYSGPRQKSKIVGDAIPFNGGVVYSIDRLLSLPTLDLAGVGKAINSTAVAASTFPANTTLGDGFTFISVMNDYYKTLNNVTQSLASGDVSIQQLVNKLFAQVLLYNYINNTVQYTPNFASGNGTAYYTGAVAAYGSTKLPYNMTLAYVNGSSFAECATIDPVYSNFFLTTGVLHLADSLPAAPNLLPLDQNTAQELMINTNCPQAYVKPMNMTAM